MKTPSGIESHPSAQVDRSIEALRKAASACRACPLWKNATQTVFGEGPAHAPVMLIGEQPGDQEDLTGHPFVGPAGQLLTRAAGGSRYSPRTGVCYQRRQALQI